MAHSYFAYNESVVTANSTATLSHQVAGNQQYDISQVLLRSTGAFDVLGIRDSLGNQYTNAGSGNGISEVFFDDVANANNTLKSLPLPIVVGNAVTFFIDVIDTSGSENTVEMLLVGVMS